MSLSNAIGRRGISEVVHFTTNRGITGVLAKKFLLSRPLLNEDEYLREVIKFNAQKRLEESAFFDKSEDWIYFVNLSISEINKRFFDISRRRHNNADVWWCILAFDPSIMLHDGVWFATTNNGYDKCTRGYGEKGFEALFAPKIARKTSGNDGRPWSVTRGARAEHLPTCEQAEVLYPEKLALAHLKKVYVEDGDHHDAVVGWLRDFVGDSDIQVHVEREKFAGRMN